MLVNYKNKLLITDKQLSGGKSFIYKGRQLMALPYNAESTTLVKQFDYKYSYPANFKPYAHQITTTNFMIQHKKAFCWNEAGTGKTASCICSYEWLRQTTDIKRILVICPTSTVYSVWVKEFFKLMTPLDTAALIGSKDVRLRLLDKNLDAYIINHDGIKVVEDELKRWQPDLIIFDEHTAIKNKRTDRWKVTKRLAENAEYIWMLSGTPMPQAPTDIFAPARIICPERVGKSFLRFRELTMYQVSQYRWKARDNVEELIKEIIHPVIRFKRQECLDLPDVVKQNIKIPFSNVQQKAFDLLKRQAVIQIENNTITAVNAGVLRSKLLQVCGGYVYGSSNENNQRTTSSLSPASRLEALRDIIEESARGILVFASFKHTIDKLESYLKKDYSVKVITGDTSIKKRTEYFKKMQDKEIKVLIAHPRTMGHGVTLTEADTVVWYSVTSDNELYEQANSRINRIGQNNKMRVIHLLSTEFENQVLRRLEEKRSMQDVLLETFGKKTTEETKND